MNIALSKVEINGETMTFIDFLEANEYTKWDVLAIIVHLQTKGEAFLCTGNGTHDTLKLVEKVETDPHILNFIAA